MEFKRFENETDDELILRICSQKDIIGTWEDVADILNEIMEKKLSSSAYRKKYQYFVMMLEANRSRFQDMNKEIDDLNKLKRELEKERAKLRTEKIEYNKWLREEARDEMILERIQDSMIGLSSLNMPSPIRTRSNNKSYLLVFTDAHYGIEYDIKDFYGRSINKYSPDIFESRMWDLLFQVVEIIEEKGIDELNVWELGDSLQGILRLNSQLMKLKYGIIESAIKYADFLAYWLCELSKFVKIKFQMVLDSNHNQLRICNAPKNAFSEENMSKVILTFIRERLKDNPNITFMDNATGMNYGLFSTYSVLGIHGEVKNFENMVNDYSRAYGIHLDYIVGGHCHHSRTKEVGIDSEAISVRSLCGVDPYGMSLNKVSNAGASLFEFTQGKGLTCEYKIKVD